MRTKWILAALVAAAVAAFLLTRSTPQAQQGTAAASAGGSPVASGAGQRGESRGGGGWFGFGGGGSDKADAAQAGVDAESGTTPKLEQPATAADGFVEVKVVRAGKPVGGAEVRLYFRGLSDPNTQAIAWRLAGAGRTGADGLLKLPARSGQYLASARAQGSAPAQKELTRRSGEPVTQTQLELQAGVSLSGRTVAAQNDEPVALAQLELLPVFARGPLGMQRRADVPAEERVHAQSDAQGRFHVDGLSPGRYRIEARAAGQASASVATDVPAPKELVIKLASASFIEGYVRDSQGRPAAGAEVVAIGGRELAVTTTTESGAFSLEVEPRTYTLTAKKGTEAGALEKPVSVAAGTTARNVEIKLGAACALIGRVVRASGGAPIAGARIDVSPHDHDGDTGRTVSAGDGAFALEGLPPGGYDVAVTADGYTRAIRRGVTVLQGQRFPLTLALTAVGSVEGVVTDSQRAPVAFALVTAESRPMDGPMGGPGMFVLAASGDAPLEARTGADGTYRIVGVPAGRVSVTAKRDGAQTGAATTTQLSEGGSARADLQLQDDGFITGRVTYKGGVPLDKPANVRAFAMGMRGAGMQMANVTTDASGAYRFQVAPGTYMVSAAGAGGQARIGGFMRNPVIVEANKTATRDLEVAPADEDSKEGFGGLVLEPDGTPSAGAVVDIQSAGGNGRMRMMFNADESGRFHVQRDRAEVPDTLVVSASNGGRTGTAQMLPGQTDVTVRMQPGATLKGKVIGAGGAAFTVSLSQADDPPFRRGADGQQFVGDQFRLDDVPAGELVVHVTTDDEREGSARVQVPSGGTAEVSVELRPPVIVTGRAVDPSGAPVQDGGVVVDGARRGVLGADGRFKVTGLAAGSHTLRVVGMNQAHSQDVKFDVRESQQLDLGDVEVDPPKAEPGSIGAAVVGNSESLTLFPMPGGPAEKAGILIGDVLASVDGTKVTNAADARVRLRGDPGSMVTLGVLRNGEPRTVQVQRAN